MKPALAIIGLGNPGASYERTRHNAGFQALDRLSKEFGEGEWRQTPKFAADTQEARVLAAAVLLAKPQTYMNDSGDCVRRIVDFYKLDPATQILVLCDDLDLPAGEVRLRLKGGPGTHNGLRSVATTYGESFPRVRIGIGGSQPRGDALAAWVLSVPPPDEQKVIADAMERLPEIVRGFVLETPKEKS